MIQSERSTVSALPATRQVPRQAWWRKRQYRRDLATALLFLLPSLLIFGVFVYYALGFNLYLSFSSWNFIAPAIKLIGLQNYLRLWEDARFWQVARNTFTFAGGHVLLTMSLGLGLALLLRVRVPGRGLFRTLIFSPYVTTTAAIALLWIWIFDPTYGLINSLLGLVGVTGPRWLTTTTWAMPAIIIMNVWQHTGYATVIFLAGLTAIPRDLYEAAVVDGAGRWTTFWRITLPLLSPTTFFLLVTSLISSLQEFDSVAVMTGGGPVDSTKTFNFFIYEQAFAVFKAGYAAAIATTLFVVILILTILQVRMAQRWVHYQ